MTDIDPGDEPIWEQPPDRNAPHGENSDEEMNGEPFDE